MTISCQGAIISAEVVFGKLQNYTLAESQQFHIEIVSARNWRRRSLYLLRGKIRLREYEEQQKHLQGEVCLDDAFFHVTDYVIEEKYGYTLCLCLFLCFRTEKGVRHDS